MDYALGFAAQVAHDASLVQLAFLQTSLKGSEDARASAEVRLHTLAGNL